MKFKKAFFIKLLIIAAGKYPGRMNGNNGAGGRLKRVRLRIGGQKHRQIDFFSPDFPRYRKCHIAGRDHL